jgi:hypothetical protein
MSEVKSRICPFNNPAKCNQDCAAFMQYDAFNNCLIITYLKGIYDKISNIESQLEKLDR